MFSYEFYEIFKDKFFTEHLCTTAPTSINLLRNRLALTSVKNFFKTTNCNCLLVKYCTIKKLVIYISAEQKQLVNPHKPTLIIKIVNIGKLQHCINIVLKTKRSFCQYCQLIQLIYKIYKSKRPNKNLYTKLRTLINFFIRILNENDVISFLFNGFRSERENWSSRYILPWWIYFNQWIKNGPFKLVQKIVLRAHKIRDNS